MFHGIDNTVYGQDYLKLHHWVQFFHLQWMCVCFVLFCFFFFLTDVRAFQILIITHVWAKEGKETSICLKLQGLMLFNSSSWLSRKFFSKMQKWYLD